MTTTPVPTCTDDLLAEIIKEFSRCVPCPHDEYELLGVGHYVKCHACGNTVEHDRLPVAKDAYDRHAELTDGLRDLSARLRAAEVDAARYRYLLTQAGRWVPMPDGSCQCEDCVEQAELVDAIVAAEKEVSQ